MAAYHRRVDGLRSHLPVHRDQLRAQRSVTSMGKLYLFYHQPWKKTVEGFFAIFRFSKFWFENVATCRNTSVLMQPLRRRPITHRIVHIVGLCVYVYLSVSQQD